LGVVFVYLVVVVCIVLNSIRARILFGLKKLKSFLKKDRMVLFLPYIQNAELFLQVHGLCMLHLKKEPFCS